MVKDTAKLVDPVAKLYFAFCKGLDTPKSLACWLLYSNHEYEQLARLKADPMSYRCAADFASDYSAVSYLKKYEMLNIPGLDTKQAAILGFHQTEEYCARTNEQLRLIARGKFQHLPRVEETITSIRQKIADILGPVPVDREQLYDWGPGATDDLKKSHAYLDEKLTKLPISVTRRAYPHLLRALIADRHWRDAIAARNINPDIDKIFKIVRGGKYDTVKKTVLTDRSICKEPRANGFLQKGVGRYIRQRLFASGCDLNNQSLNQLLASIAKICNLATLDLESASDSVSKELVYFLLPIDWAILLDDLRSHEVKINDTWHELEKFSSMGNGFTFELESLIFYAIVGSVEKKAGRRLFGVYGDDLICHQDNAPHITEVLEVLGFRLNRDKSFTSGNFFESCGKHYYDNIDVTPAYQKEALGSKGSYIRASTRLIHLALRLGASVSLDSRLNAAYEHSVRCSRIDSRFHGPIDLERSDYIQTSIDKLRHVRHGSFGPYCNVLAVVNQVPNVTQFEDAAYAISLRRSTRSALLPDPLFSRRNLMHNWSDPQCLDSGFVESRLVSRETTQHRRVQVHGNTACLTW